MRVEQGDADSLTFEALNAAAKAATANPETDLRVLQKRAYATSAAHGFHEDGDTIRARLKHWQGHVERQGNEASYADRKELALWETIYRRYVGNNIALLHSEATEAFEHLRDGRDPDEIFFVVKDDGTVKPDGFPIELADLLIRILDTAEELKLDVAAATAMKMQFNEMRPHKHGRTM